ncbi:MAG: hypothetical protein LBS97_06790 [Treponema sp.]|jgi:hypothetical protein|nr:hypothetical protein [Treponema sp.]
MKKLLLFPFFLFCALAYGEQFRIAEVKYDITGITKEYALRLAVPIDEERVFYSFEEFDGYINLIRQELINQRTLANTELTYSTPETGRDDLILVMVMIRTKDTWNIFGTPYPKYNSNNGFEFKLKLKDYNFLGLMRTLTFDLNYNYDLDRERQGKDPNTIGINFDYVLPFQLHKFDAEWTNYFSLNWAFLDETDRAQPEFTYTTGVGVTFPLNNSVKLRFSVRHSIRYEYDYKEQGDALYSTEYAELALPLVIGWISEVTPVSFTPNLHFTYNWDKDGIAHPDLQSPTAGPGYSIGAWHINWHDNFRKGYAFSFGQNFDWNFDEKKKEANKQFVPSIRAEFSGFGASKYIGITERTYFVAYYNNTEDIGGRLRGILDSQRWIGTSMALVVNLDIPVKIVQTDWRGWGKWVFQKIFRRERDMPSWFGVFDFELQVLPFADIALIHNGATGRTFSLQDGWYAAGFEVLIFPSRWRSIQGRFSYGIDMGRRFLADKIDMSWRENKPDDEISIGIGLFY